LQSQPSSRVRRLQVSRLGFVLLAATVLSLINAGSVLQRTSSFSRASPGIFALQTAIEVALLWCTMAALVLPAAFNNRILKIWTLLLVGLGFISSYYVVRLNVGIDISVIRSILSTDQQEVVEFIDPLSVLLLVAVVASTIAVLATISIVPRYQATGKIVFAPRPIGVLSLTGALLLGVVSSHHAFGQIDATQFFKTGLARYSPLNLLVYGVKYGRHAWRTRHVIVQDISPQFDLDDTARGGEVVVIVLGESARSANFQLAGYNRPTNPRLSRESDLIFFKDVTACRTHTAEAIPCLLTRFGNANLSFPITEVSLISIFKRLGFETKWYSMQAALDYDICQEAGICRVAIGTRKQGSKGAVGGNVDEELLPFLKRSLAERKQGRLLVVLHLLGSHAVYSERYPRAWAHFRPECKGAAYACPPLDVVNSYDNSIRYTDHVLAEAIEMLRAENAILFFTSDHGESLGELGVYGHGWPTSLAPKEQMKVPLAIWASPQFIASRKDEWASLRTAASKAAASKSVTHDYFFHTVLGCSGVRSTLLRSDLNLCANDIIASTGNLVRVSSGVSSRCGIAFSDYVRRHQATLSRRGSDCEKEPGPASQCCWTTTKPASRDPIADISLLGNRNLLSNSN
jgi:KDO II ethanolaminephosphotransferase